MLFIYYDGIGFLMLLTSLPEDTQNVPQTELAMRRSNGLGKGALKDGHRSRGFIVQALGEKVIVENTCSRLV